MLFLAHQARSCGPPFEIVVVGESNFFRRVENEVLLRAVGQQLGAAFHFEVDSAAILAGKLESHENRPGRRELRIGRGETFLAIRAVVARVFKLHDRQIAVGVVRALELREIVAERQMPRPERDVPRNARLADPLIAAGERIDDAAVAENLAFHQRPRRGQHDRVMLVPRIDIPQRRQHFREEFVSSARPAAAAPLRPTDRSSIR